MGCSEGRYAELWSRIILSSFDSLYEDSTITWAEGANVGRWGR